MIINRRRWHRDVLLNIRRWSSLDLLLLRRQFLLNGIMGLLLTRLDYRTRRHDSLLSCLLSERFHVWIRRRHNSHLLMLLLILLLLLNLWVRSIHWNWRRSRHDVVSDWLLGIHANRYWRRSDSWVSSTLLKWILSTSILIYWRWSNRPNWTCS